MGRMVRDNNSGGKKKIIVIFLVVLLILGAIVGLAYARANSDKTLKGVSVNGVDIGDMSEDEAREIINDYKNQLENKAIILRYEGNKNSFYGKDIGIKISSIVLDEALNYGKDENFFNQVYLVVGSFLGKKYDISEDVKINEESLKEKVDNLISSTGTSAVNATAEVGEEEIIIVKGHDGIRPKYEEIANEVIKQASTTASEVDVDVVADIDRSVDVDIEALYNRVHVEKKNAEYTAGGVYSKEQIGVSFNQSEAYTQYRSLPPDGKMTIKLIREMPEITTENLAKILFADVLGTFKTEYNASNYNRSTNLSLAAKNINDKIFLPNEIFSYNKEVGERTAARGFKEAHVYSGGEVVDGLGGGICQISSSLYNAVLRADLEVIERKNHMFWPEYVSPSLDATVAWGSIDFKFKNNRKTPIKISASAQNGVATVTIYGKKEANEPKISIEWKKLEEYEPTTITRNDDSLAPGTQVVAQSPVKGYKSEAYKIYLDPLTGKETKREKISTDIYKATDKIIKIGAKIVETPKPTIIIIEPTNTPVSVKTQTPVNPYVTQPAKVTTRAPQKLPISTSSSGWPSGWDTPENPNYRG